MRGLQDLVKATRPYCEEQISRSWWNLANTLLAIGASLIVINSPLPFIVRLLASLFMGLVWVRMFILYHDYEHGAIFTNSKLAKGIMSFYGTFVLNPPNVWNRSHNYHHNKNSQIATASIGSFPIMTVKEYEAAPLAKKLQYRFARSAWVFLFGHVAIFVIGMCVKSLVTDPKRHWDSLVALVLHVGLMYGLYVWGGWEFLILNYLLPLYIACMLGAYLFFIQHNFPDVKFKPRADWDYGFAALNSSSFMEGSRITHWLTGNIGYHHIHHINARIPFYRLPEVMAAIPEFQNPGRTSLHPREIYRCLRLKLWDPQKDRMVTFRGNPV